MADWFEELPADLTTNVDGKPVNIKEHPFVKESPDLPHFVRKAFDTHREVGSRIPIRITNDNEKEQWRKDHLPKLYEAGLLMKPPGSPDDYKIDKPTGVPDGMTWSEELVGEFRKTLHKHGIPPTAVPDLLALQEKALTASFKAFNTDYDTAIGELKKEFGDKYDERFEQAKRFTPLIVKNEKDLQFLESSGLGNHPNWLAMIMRLAPFIAQDSSLVDQSGRPTMDVDATIIREELSRVLSDKKHPDHEKYWRGDPATIAKYDEMYKKAYGDKKIEIGGITVTGKPA